MLCVVGFGGAGGEEEVTCFSYGAMASCELADNGSCMVLLLLLLLCKMLLECCCLKNMACMAVEARL
jgi:hypothetical protein